MTNTRNMLNPQGQLLRWLRLAVHLLLIVLIARAAAHYTWDLVDSRAGSRSSAVDQLSSESAEAAADLQGKNAPASPGTTFSLFGKPAEKMAAEPTREPEPVVAPETSLNLVLKGVIAATPMSGALAIISEKSRNDDLVYGVGDAVPGNATVHEIYNDRVILLRAGKFETLYLEDIGELASLPGYGNKVRDAVNSGRQIDPTTIRGGVTDLGEGVYAISQGYKEAQLANLATLSREVGIRPYEKDGEDIGYQVVAARGKGNQMLKELGIKARDVITRVNGYNVSEIKKNINIVKELKGSAQLLVEGIRDGQPFSATYKMQ